MHSPFLNRLLDATRGIGLSIAFAGTLIVSASAQGRYKIFGLPTPTGYNSAALGLNDNGNVGDWVEAGD
jgi:hypothetical protein